MTKLSVSGAFESSVVVWGGRNDNPSTEKIINSFPVAPVLMWTDTTRSIDVSSAPLKSDDYDKVFIILDGTWQEAEKMYRKGPSILRRLEKLHLSSVGSTDKDLISSSRYVLRRDFGYRHKYGTDDGCSLLCTAESCAGILRGAGLLSVEEELLRSLVAFQSCAGAPVKSSRK